MELAFLAFVVIGIYEFVSLLVSSIVAYVVFLLYKRSHKKKKISIVPFLLIPIFFCTIMTIFMNQGLNFIHDLTTINQRIAQGKYLHQVHAETIKQGIITQVDDGYLYTCKECGYALLLPKSWGFYEAFSTFDNYRGIVATVLSPEYNQGSHWYFQRFRGQKFDIEWANDSRVNQNTLENIKIFEQIVAKKINGNSFSIYYRRNAFSGDPKSEANVYIDGNMNLRILVQYNDEKDLEKNLNILLRNLKFLGNK